MNLEKLSRVIAVASAVYAASAITINVGYMSSIGPLASEAFSLADVLQVNVFLVRTLFYLALMYGAFSMVSWPLHLAVGNREWFIKKKAFFNELFIAIMVDNSWLGFLFFVCIWILLPTIRSLLSGAGLFVEFIPLTLWVWVITKYLLYLHNTTDFDRPIFWLLLAFNPFILAYDLGGTWAKYDKQDTNRIISIQYENGTCIERRLLRLTSNGFVLFNDFNRRYEVRGLHGVQGYIPGKVCL